MPARYLREMARLLQTYKDLHPYRIARRYGVSEAFVRELASRYQPEDLPPLCEALEVLYGRHDNSSAPTSSVMPRSSNRSIPQHQVVTEA